MGPYFVIHNVPLHSNKFHCTHCTGEEADPPRLSKGKGARTFTLDVRMLTSAIGRRKTKKVLRQELEHFYRKLSRDMRTVLAEWVLLCLRRHRTEDGTIVYRMHQLGRSSADERQLIIPYLAVRVSSSTKSVGRIADPICVRRVQGNYRMIQTACSTDDGSSLAARTAHISFSRASPSHLQSNSSSDTEDVMPHRIHSPTDSSSDTD